MTPALCTWQPQEASPSATRSAIQALDSRVSWPITTPACGLVRTRLWPSARPIRNVLSWVKGNSPATPRIPSVPKSCRVCEVIRNTSSGTIAGCLLHNNCNPDGSSVGNLDERIRDVWVPDEGHAAHGSAYVDGVGSGGFYCLNAPFWPGDGYGGGIAEDLADVVSLHEAADDAGLHTDRPGQPHIECEMELAGHDLHHFQACGLMNLLGGEVESAFAGFDAVELDGGINIRRLQLTNGPLGAAQADLRLGSNFGADLEILRDITNFHRDFDCNFRNGIASDSKPQSYGQGNRDQLEAKIVQDAALEEIAHG